MSRKHLHLGAFMRPVSIHTAAWRYPGGTPDANFNFEALVRYARTLERGRFDAFFMADHLAVLNMPMEALKRSATVTSFDPLTLLPALAQHTRHLGLIATASTTFEPAYTIARRFASLDHLSNGRAGWNIVTTSNPDAAQNFGMDDQMPHDERYARAREFYDVVTGLWDSWADDAFVRDVESGIYFDPARLHVLNHRGKYLKVRGPLNIARPIQGWPVIVQAGASDAGRQLAAETAEMVFAAGGPIEQGRAFYADVKGRAARAGRNPDHIKILPGAFVVIGESLQEARDKRALLDSLVSYDSGIAALSIATGVDARRFDPDGPLPELPETNQSKSGRERVMALARREGLTVRQLAGRLGGYGGLGMVGTPATIADQMQEWLETGASDGFNVMFPYLPGGLDDFVDKVVPELQRRGIFRTEYEGRTLRENLGLPRPDNRFFAPRAMAGDFMFRGPERSEGRQRGAMLPEGGSMANFEIATASDEDVVRIIGWARDEGWNPANTDRFAFQAADPGGFLMGRLDGEPVACISVVRYGAGFGFLGCYIARPSVRGKGYGIRLWNAGMKRLAGRNVGLDGVPAQQANYRKSGYRLAWNNARHEGVPAAAPLPAGVTLVDARSLPFDRLAAYDRRFFPEPRDSFLSLWITLAERAALVALKDGEIVGFGVVRAAVTASRIGPLYAASPELAAALIGKLAAAMPGRPIAVDMPDCHGPGTRMAEQLGLRPAFETARMYTGPDPEIDGAGLFGVASLELG